MNTPRTDKSGSSRSTLRMTRRKLSTGAKTLIFALLMTGVGLTWVWKGSWFEQVSHQQLALEKQELDLQNEAGNLRRELLQLSQYTRVESVAKEKLGMIFPTTPPDTIWTEGETERASIGSMVFFASLAPKGKPSLHHR